MAHACHPSILEEGGSTSLKQDWTVSKKPNKTKLKGTVGRREGSLGRKWWAGAVRLKSGGSRDLRMRELVAILTLA
jgi:hypothetical protein